MVRCSGLEAFIKGKNMIKLISNIETMFIREMIPQTQTAVNQR